MKGAVMDLLVGALDLWEGCGWGAWRLSVPSWPPAETSIFLQGLSLSCVSGLPAAHQAPCQAVVMEMLAKHSFLKGHLSFHCYFFPFISSYRVWDF